jgi:hypothetical protein
MGKSDEYRTLRLKKETMDRMRDLKESYEMTYGRKMTYDEFCQKLVACVEDGDVAVWELFCLRQQQREDALERAKALNEKNV